ncbi:MAG: hypothetical protein V2G33_07790 [bacterium JZ-2024 1]
MKVSKLSLAFLLLGCLAILPKPSYAAPPVLLWHRDIAVSEARISANGLTVVGKHHCAYGTPCEFDPGTFFVLDGNNGQTLWQIPINIDKTIHSFFVSSDGQKIVLSEILQTPQEYKEVEYWADAIGPYITRVFNRDGTLFSQFAGGAGMLSGNGQYLYIHGIQVQVDPDNDIYKFRHGVFRVDGTEVWTQTIEPVGGFYEVFRWYRPPISHTANLLARECLGYKINGAIPENCPGASGSGIIVYDGLTGTMLYTKATGFEGSLSVSPSGNFLLVEDHTNMSQLNVYGRDGSLVFTKDLGSGVRSSLRSSDDSRIAVGTNDNRLFWLNSVGDVLWEVLMPGNILDVLQISSDNRVINLHYQVRIGNAYYYRTAIINGLNGQILHTFPSKSYITSDGNKALVFDPAGAYIQLYDITPLFSGEKKTKGERCKADRETG